MNGRQRVLFCATAAVILVIAGCGEPADVLTGGGFEPQSELQKSPTEWFATVVPKTREFVAFTWDDQIVRSGERSVAIAIAANHPEDVIAYNWTKPVPACKVGKTYELSGWIRTENMTGPAWIVVQSWNAAMDEMLGFASTQQDYAVTGTTEWTQVGVVFSVPEGTAEVRIRAGVAAPENNGGKAWFDDLRVREVN
jgi:hypothetical protein